MLDEADKRIILAALGYVSLESPDLKPHVRALLTRARGIVRKKVIVRRRALAAGEQLSLDLTFRKLPAGVKRRGRARWAKYPFKFVEDARAMRKNGFTYREIADALNREHGTQIRWITVRDWTSQFYRVTG